MKKYLLILILIPLLVFAKNSSDHEIKSPNNIRLESGSGVQSDNHLTVENEKELRLGDSGSNYVSLKSPTVLAVILDFTLPGLDGSSGECLQTNGSGVLSFGVCDAADVLTETNAKVVTNKTMDADNNTFSNFEHGSEVDNPVSGVHGVVGNVVGTTDAQALTNKTLDGDLNTVSNLAHGAEVDDPSSGVHGVAGSVVGTADTQDLSGKTFTDPVTVEEQGAHPTTPASGDKKIYCLSTDDTCYTKNDAGDEVELGAGGGGDVNNLLTDGGFDSDATTGTDGLTCTVGTCSQELTIKKFGESSLKIVAAAASLSVIKCFDNTDANWDNTLVQDEGLFRTDQPGVEICHWDGTVSSNCFTHPGDDSWVSFKIVEQVLTENDICWQIKSGVITGNVYVDSTSIRNLVADGTTKVTVDNYVFSDDTVNLTNAGSPSFIRWGTLTDTDSTVVNLSYDDSNGRFTALRDNVHVNLTADIRSATVWVGSIFLNGVRDTRVNQSANLHETLAGTYLLNTGDYLQTDINQNTPASGVDFYLKVKATHYEQKTILSDATAESTLTNYESYFPTLVGVDSDYTTNLLYKRLGDLYHITGSFVAGTTPTAVEFQLPLPNSHTVKAGVNVSAKGTWYRGASSASSGGPVLVTGGDAFVNISTNSVFSTGVVNPLTPSTGSGSIVGGETVSIDVMVPIDELDSKPQIVGTFKANITDKEATASGAIALVTSTTTFIDFDTVIKDDQADYDGCGNGNQTTSGTATTCKFICPETGPYLVNTKMHLNATANWGPGEVCQTDIYVEGVEKFINQVTSNGGVGSFTVPCWINKKVQCAKGERIEVAVTQTSGGNTTLDGNPANNWLEISKAEVAGRLSNETPKKFQEKILQADVTTDNIDVADFTYTGLTIGEHYRISGQLIGFNSGGGDNYAMIYNSAAAGAGTVYGECKQGSDTTLYEFCGINIVFKAVSTTLYFHTESLSPAQFNGDGTKKESFVQLNEENMTETTQW